MRKRKLNTQDIVDKIIIYDLLGEFSSTKEMLKWISKLNKLQIKNILSLNIDKKKIKFDTKLLIDGNLLNTEDYLNRVNAIVSIDNAKGWEHLFEYLVTPKFLKSEKFYKDIETLKKADCAQKPLWIIGEPDFINSPYHDEDFELLVTAKDNSDKKNDSIVQEAIATIAECDDSIKSGYHKVDLNTVMKYGSKALQLTHSFPESGINILATNPVSLKSKYHLEDMKILAENQEIGNFLYAVMTDSRVVKRKNYRKIVKEMVDNKNNKEYVFLICYYALGEYKTKFAQSFNEFYVFNLSRHREDLPDVLKSIDKKINSDDKTDEDELEKNIKSLAKKIQEY
jgi:hypothetical protein